MAESNFIYYRGFPMVRSGNEIYYGSMGDRFVTKLTIRESEKTRTPRYLPRSWFR